MWIWGCVWALPLHVIALLLLPFYEPRGIEVRNGKLEIRVHRAIGNPGGQTWGQVTFYVVEPWEALRRHEDRHTVQAWIFGPLLLVLYPLASLIAILAGAHYHDGNVFELDAYRKSGVR